MTQRLTRHGDGLALVLDRSLVEAAGLDEGHEVEIATDGDLITITPVRTTSHQAKLGAVMNRLHARYAGAFRRLAQ